jgi:hypothetical protein
MRLPGLSLRERTSYTTSVRTPLAPSLQSLTQRYYLAKSREERPGEERREEERSGVRRGEVKRGRGEEERSEEERRIISVRWIKVFPVVLV